MDKSAFKYCIIILLLLTSSAGYSKEVTPFEKAEKLFFQKKFSGAKKILLKVVKEESGHPKAYSYLGDIELHRGNYRGAIKYYNRAKTVSDNPSMEYFRMGQVYIKLKNEDQALENFQKSYSLNPAEKTPLYQIGYVYLVMKRDKYKTIEYWRRFIQEAPSDLQYDSVKKAIKYLENEKCVIPGKGSDDSLEELLKLGCKTVVANKAKPEDQSAGNEKEKINNKTESLLDDTSDDDL